MFLQRPLLFFDLETTGVDISKDRIIQIGIVKVHPNGKRETFEYLVNPTIPIPAEATAVHGISDEAVKNMPTFYEISLKLMEIFKDCDIAGFNSNRFDVPFLFEELSRAGITWDYTAHKFVDVYTMYARTNERTLQEAYAKYVGGEFNAHDAIADVNATIDVFYALLREHEELPITVSELDLYSLYDKKRADLSGKFYYKDEELYFNFGSKKDELVKDHMGFIQWMPTKNFSKDVVLFCKKIEEAYKNKTL